jgi:hypothetical protein
MGGTVIQRWSEPETVDEDQTVQIFFANVDGLGLWRAVHLCRF